MNPLNPLKRLYLWLNHHMIAVAVLILVLAVPIIFLPALGGPIFAFIILMDLFFGIGDNLTGWWDELEHSGPEAQD